MQPKKDVEYFKMHYYEKYFIGEQMPKLSRYIKNMEKEERNKRKFLIECKSMIASNSIGILCKKFWKKDLGLVIERLHKLEIRLEAAKFIKEISKNIGWRPTNSLPEDHYAA